MCGAPGCETDPQCQSSSLCQSLVTSKLPRGLGAMTPTPGAFRGGFGITLRKRVPSQGRLHVLKARPQVVRTRGPGPIKYAVLQRGIDELPHANCTHWGVDTYQRVGASLFPVTPFAFCKSAAAHKFFGLFS